MWGIRELFVGLLVLAAKSAHDQSWGVLVQPLHLACEMGRTNLVALLLSRGADRSRLAMDKYTPLTLALMQGRSDIVAMLQ